MDCIEILGPSLGGSNETSTVERNANGNRELLTFDNALGNDKRRWMTSLANKLGGQARFVTLRDFVLPGSHNSASNSLLKAEWCDKNSFSGWTDPGIVAVCQNQSILGQLNNGIRYFDLRVVDTANFENLASYPLHHTFIALKGGSILNLDMVLRELSSFLDRNPGEFIVARIKTNRCDNDSLTYGGWRNEFFRIYWDLPRLRQYWRQSLDITMDELKGKLHVDIDGLHKELYSIWQIKE